ncbi:hypothetical protein [Micromonospora sp. HM134]|uniref:hypothetical protein n=1 Tax=Micromonospora sp. HM134 TaxID=2583243 RepID=UPI00143D20F3|nr:hypothetical protein [Micromonospora sp. HM134]
MSIRPIAFAWFIVNHSAPSGPDAMPYGPPSRLGTGNRVVSPSVVIRLTRWAGTR